MEKPYILVKEEMKEEISDVINKYVNTCMASDIADHLTKIAVELQKVHARQVEAAKKQYEESEKGETEE